MIDKLFRFLCRLFSARCKDCGGKIQWGIFYTRFPDFITFIGPVAEGNPQEIGECQHCKNLHARESVDLGLERAEVLLSPETQNDIRVQLA